MAKPSEELIRIVQEHVTVLQQSGGSMYIPAFTETMNRVYKNMTGEDKNLFFIKYPAKESNPDIDPTYQPLDNYAPPEQYSNEAEMDLENLSPDAEEMYQNFEECLNMVAESFYEVLGSYEVSENARLASSTKANRAEQVAEYLGLQVQELQDTIDNIFREGDQKEDES